MTMPILTRSPGRLNIWIVISYIYICDIYIYVIQSSVLKRVQPWIQIVTNSEAGGVNFDSFYYMYLFCTSAET